MMALNEKAVNLIVGVALGALLSSVSIAQERRDDAPMVYIPAGEFTMGTSIGEAQRLAKDNGVHPTLFKSETPQRKVFVKAFLIDKYPVTNAQYKKFIDATGHNPPSGWNGRSFPSGMGDHPVVNVRWHDANAYAKWAGKRLPTEEEWEKAARGADARAYPWGNEWSDEACRIADGKLPYTRPLTIPVGCFPKGESPYGVMDMVGNVAEWTSTYACPPNPKRKWAWYVVKGAGAAHTMKFNFRCASRNFSAHTSRCHLWLGFRCAKGAEGTPAAATPPDAMSPMPVTEIAPAKGPIAAMYGKQPIKIVVGGSSAGARFTAPCFPEGGFSLYVPEQAGAAGVPLAWAASRSRFQWETNEDQTLAKYECHFQGKAVMTTTLKSGADFVDFTIAIRNLTDKPFKGVHSNTCLNNHNSPYFDDPERARTMVWLDDGPALLLDMPVGASGEILHNGWAVAKPTQKAPKGGSLVRYPFIFIRSRDRQWVVAQAYGEGVTVASNAHYSCLHSRPVWPDIPPGEERSVTGKLYFIKGGPDDLLRRWKADFAEVQ